MSADLAELTTLLTSLPDDASPYLALSAWLHAQVEASLPAATKSVLAVNAVCFGLSWILALATIVGKIYDRQAWIVQTRRTPRGTIWLLNSGLTYSAVALVFLSLGLGYMATIYTSSFGSSTPVARQTIEGVTWSLPALALWTEASSVCSALFLAKSQRSPRSRFAIRAWHVNGLFVVFFLITLGVVVPLFAAASVKFSEAWDQLEHLEASFMSSEATWRPGQPFVLDPSWIPSLETLNDAFDDYCRFEQICFGCLAGLLLVLVLTFVPSSLGHIRILRGHVREVSNRFRSRRDALTKAQAAREQHQHHTLRRTVHMLVLEIVALFVISAVYLTLSLRLARSFKQLSQNGTDVLVDYALALSFYSAFGGAVHIMLAYRTFLPLFRRRQFTRREARRITIRPILLSKPKPADGILISTATHVAYDHHAEDEMPSTPLPLDHIDIAAVVASRDAADDFVKAGNVLAINLPAINVSGPGPDSIHDFDAEKDSWVTTRGH